MRIYIKIGWFIFLTVTLTSCKNNGSSNHELVDYLPEHTQSLLKINHWETTASDFTKNPVINQMDGEPFSSFFKNKLAAFPYVTAKSNVVLSLSKVNDTTHAYTLIGRASSTQFYLDSLPEAQISSFEFEGTQIRKINLKEHLSYCIQLDSMAITSTSETVVKELLQRKFQKDSILKKAYHVKNEKELTYVGTLKHGVFQDSIPQKLASHTAFELQLLPDGVVAHGVVLDKDSLPELLSAFKGQIPQKNEAPTIIPINTIKANAFTFSNLELFQNNLAAIQGHTPITMEPLFETVNEVVQITTPNGRAIALKSLDMERSWEALGPYLTEQQPFREVPVFQLSDKNLFAPFYPLLHPNLKTWIFEWDDFLVFSETRLMAESLLTDYQNEAILSKTPYYENEAPYLAQASSWVEYQLRGDAQGLMPLFLGSSGGHLSKFPLAITQLIYDRDFAHLNLVAKEASKTQPKQGSVAEIARITLENNMLMAPQFFTNHNTLGQDIVVQDVANVLYFISSNGKILWKKTLDGPLLGAVQEIDLLRNGKKQLTFNTHRTWYVLDRNGHEVGPFPKHFNDAITQPLSLFDYDNNRKYRFVITQGNSLLMYDGEGKMVNGFTFKKTTSNIVMAPQHIRMGNKDYILVAEENGKLHILSRVGKVRVPINRTFQFSGIPIEKEGSEFVVITKDLQKVSITQTGTVKTQALGVSKNYWFTILGNTKVTLDDNLLRINGKLTDELPLGIYSKPQIFHVNQETYVSVAELQEHKVYLFDKSGSLIKNFPVYGNSKIDLADANKNKKLNLLVKGADNELILYQLN